jgi:hypothetical protein
MGEDQLSGGLHGAAALVPEPRDPRPAAATGTAPTTLATTATLVATATIHDATATQTATATQPTTASIAPARPLRQPLRPMCGAHRLNVFTVHCLQSFPQCGTCGGN